MEQALLSQLDRCPYFNARNVQLSLFSGGRCGWGWGVGGDAASLSCVSLCGRACCSGSLHHTYHPPTPAPTPTKSHLALKNLPPDYHAGMEQLPTQLAQTLPDHGDEVWALQFSHGGALMASASKDGSAILWCVCVAGGGLVG